MESLRCGRALARCTVRGSDTARLSFRNQAVRRRSFHKLPRSFASKPTISFAHQLRTSFQAQRGPQKLQPFRAASTEHVPKPGRVIRFVYKGLAGVGFFFLGTGALVVGFFVYDATTYKETYASTDIPVSETALSPRRGGPKNLPIAECLVDDDDSPRNIDQKGKPRLVILGTGWASVALLKSLHPGEYHVTVVSPANHFLFTPMLPSATVGTLEFRSLVEPVRRIVARIHGHFLKAEAEDVEFSEQLVEVSQIAANGEKQHFYIPYDKLVIGVGACICRISCERYANWFQAAQPMHMASKALKTAISSNLLAMPAI